MKSVLARRTTRLLAGLALASLASSALAASTWTSTTCSGTSLGGYGNSFSCNGTNSGPTATVTAWSSSTSSTSGYKFATASVGSYGGGFGVANQIETLAIGQPEHSTDNYTNGVTDLVAFSFSSSVILKQLQLGYSQTDADVSVLRYVGSATTLAAALTGFTVSGLVSNGWELVGNYGHNSSSSAFTETINSGLKSSSWWLVSAYNSGFGTAGESTGTLTDGNDYVKILSVSGDKAPPQGGQIPEPGSLALMGAALFGVIGLRRRKGQSALQAS